MERTSGNFRIKKVGERSMQKTTVEEYRSYAAHKRGKAPLRTFEIVGLYPSREIMRRGRLYIVRDPKGEIVHVSTRPGIPDRLVGPLLGCLALGASLVFLTLVLQLPWPFFATVMMACLVGLGFLLGREL